MIYADGLIFLRLYFDYPQLLLLCRNFKRKHDDKKKHICFINSDYYVP